MPSLRRLLGQRHDRGVARMAHHRDAVGLGGDRLAQLLHHLLDVPAGEDVVDLGARVGGRLLGAVVDDGAEGVAFGAADEEAELHVLAPVVAQRLRVRGRHLRDEGHGEHKAGSQCSQSHRHPPVFVGVVPARGGLVGHERRSRRGTPSDSRAPASARSSPARRDRPGRASPRCRSSPCSRRGAAR